ncbi:MAG: M1 family metallopeptidase [Acidimicrobiia bacterium]|nr:M1 family metallopeptidase [Acidimicrobiia bacterium]
MSRPLVLLVVLAFALGSCGDGSQGGSWITTGLGTTTAATTVPPDTTATTTPGTSAPSTPTTTPPTTVPSASGVGDPYFPGLGNPGYDVEHYAIAIEVDDTLRQFPAASTSIDAVAVETLDEFSLDFAGMTIDSVTLDGAAASFERQGEEVLVTPPAAIPAGEGFTVVVEYHGTPLRTTVPSLGFEAGWITVGSTAYAFAEPNGAHSWFPGSDHPSDKATFTIAAAVPTHLGFTAVSNGTLIAETADGVNTTFTWEMDDPMATYLATLAIGPYTRYESTEPGGIELRDYVPSSYEDAPAAFGRVAEMLVLFTDWFGPYPFDEYGHVIVAAFPGAMETQTMTMMGADAVDDGVVAHELAHQWFGDSVTPTTWRDIWLNEGFATFAEFLWVEEAYGEDAAASYITSLHSALQGQLMAPISDPGIAELFGTGVYWRGGLTLAALRTEVGDETMRSILTTYHSRFRHGNAATADFIAVAEEISGRDLGAFFADWLDEQTLPPLPA